MTQKTFHEPDPQVDLIGSNLENKEGAKVILKGKGKHFEKFSKLLEDAGMIAHETMVEQMKTNPNAIGALYDDPR